MTYNKTRDQEVTKAFASGDPSAFNDVYNRYKKPLFSYISRSVRNEELAQDIVQDVFSKVYRFQSSYDPSHALSTWLWKIAMNTTYDFLRKHRHEQKFTELADPASQTPSVETLIDEGLEKTRMVSLFNKLTHMQKTVLKLRILEQLSYGEISKRCNLSLASVKCLVYRANQTLREEISLHSPA